MIFYFILGSIFGSFAHLLYQRTLEDENIAYPPSHCPKCKKRILVKDLVPIISYINLKGRCRFCKEKIPISYFLYEIFGGLLFIFSMRDRDFLEGSFIFISLIISFVVAMIDLKSLNVYMIYVYILVFLGFIYRILYLSFDLEFIKICTIFTLIYLFIYFISKKNIGDGDYFFYISLFLFLENYKIYFLILGSIWIGGIFAIIIAIKNKSMKVIMPFCIYIFLSYLIALL